MSSRPSRQPAERPTRVPPPSRDPGWVVLLALTACGIVAALLASGTPKGDPPPSSEVAATSAQGESPGTPARAGSGSPSTSPTAPVRAVGTGRIAQVRTSGEDTDRGGREVRWTVEAEQGLGIDLDDFSATVAATLRDARGWEGEVGVHFVRVPSWQAQRGARVDVRVTLASPRTTDRLCAPMATAGEVSCWHDGRAVINAKRWVQGAPSYAGRRAAYRTYLVNHEVGHGLGYAHEPCAASGRRAPVMLQQTLGLGGCRAWPYPQGDGSVLR